MDDEEFEKKEDFLDTLQYALGEAKNLKDDYYADVLESLVIELRDEVEEQELVRLGLQKKENEALINEFNDVRL
jgi:hypothetical protein